MERGSVYHVVSILSAFGVTLLRYKCIALYLDKDQGAEIRNKQSETIYSICVHMYNQHMENWHSFWWKEIGYYK